MLIDLAATAEVFHTPTGIAYADLTIDGNRKPGRCAVRVFAPGYGAAIMKRPEMSQARQRLLPRSICLKRRRSSMVPGEWCMGASPRSRRHDVACDRDRARRMAGG